MKSIPRDKSVVFDVIGPSISYIRISKNTHSLVDSGRSEHYRKFRWFVTAKRCLINGRIKILLYPGRHNNKNKAFMLHREVLGVPSEVMVSHLNGNTLDNRLANLTLSSKNTVAVRNKYVTHTPSLSVGLPCQS